MRNWKHRERVSPSVEKLRQDVDALGELKGEAYFLREAIKEACIATLEGHRGVGAVVVQNDAIHGRGHNKMADLQDPLYFVNHAEIDTIRDYHENIPLIARDAGGARIYTTREPCPMCTFAAFNAGIPASIAGSIDETGGQLISNANLVVPAWASYFRWTGTHHRLAHAPEELLHASKRIWDISKGRV